MTIKGSPVLNMVTQLKVDSSEILSCGAYLDFYELIDALKSEQQPACTKMLNSCINMVFSCTTDTIQTETVMLKNLNPN